MSKTIRIGVIGFGWMGQAHSRGCRRAPSYFLDRDYEPELVVVSDTVEARRDDAVRSFGYQRAVTDWHEVVDADDVDVVFVTAPNMLHVEMVEATAAAGKPVFCEKPVGGTPPQTVDRRAGCAPRRRDHRRRVQLPMGSAGAVRQAVDRQRRDRRDHQLLRPVLLDVRQRSRWACCRGGSSSTRPVTASAPTSSATRSTSATISSEGSARSSATGETFIKQRPLPTGGGTHYDRGKPGDPTGEVTNEDYIGMMCTFENGARGTFEACRSMVGPESQNSFEVYGTKGSVAWNFEKMNELRVYIAAEHKHTGFTTVFGGDRFPPHGNFVPGSANSIGFEDLICIEDHEFLQSVAAGRQHTPGLHRGAGLRVGAGRGVAKLGERPLGRRRLTEGGMR